MMIKGLPVKLHELAMYYRGSSDGERKGQEANMMDDVIFLVGYFTNRTVEFIRGAINAVTGILESQPIMALRLQLSIALAVTLDFATRVIQVSYFITSSKKNFLSHSSYFVL